MAENNHDFAHFKFVHGGEDIPWETEELIADSPYKKTSSPTGFVRETFTKEESGILDYRRWAEQFYSEPARASD